MAASSGTALAVYDKVTDPVSFCTAMAKPFSAAAGVPLDQGEAVAFVCLSEGITPYQYRRRYHTTPFGPAMRADAMRAELRMNHGGDFEIIESTPDVAHIKFTDANGRTYDSKITWEQAQGEPWPWKKDKGPGTPHMQPTIANLKDNWATPLSRQNMLLARCTSRGLRAFLPELVAGIYTPEEMSDLGVEVVGAAVSTIAAPRKTAAEIVAEQAAKDAAVVVAAADGDVVDAVFEAKEEKPVDTADPTPGTATKKQCETINELIDKLRMPPAAVEAMLVKREVNAVRSLSKEQAKTIIENLNSKLRLETSAASPN